MSAAPSSEKGIRRLWLGYVGLVDSPLVSLGRRWLLPALLSIAMFGQLSFSLLQFRYGVQHPAWPVWGGIAFLTAIFVWKALSRFAWPDALFIAFFALLIVGYFRGQAPAFEFVYRLAGFILLPYVAARTLDYGDIGRFIICGLIVCALVAGIAVVEIAMLPPAMLAQDRILLFFNREIAGSGGVPSQIYIASAMGGLIALSTAVVLGKRTELSRWLAFGSIGLFVGAMVLVLAGTRAVMVISVAVVLFGAIFVNRPGWQIRALPLALIVVGGVFGGTISSSSRLIFLSQLMHPDFNIVEGLPEEEELPFEVQQGCLPRGATSISIRILLLSSAWKQFAVQPVLGTGLGEYTPVGCEGAYAAFDSPHNMLAHAFVEGGLPMGLILLALLVSPVRLLKQDVRQFIPLGALLVYGLFVLWEMMSGSIFGDGQIYAALGIALSACQKPDDQTELLSPGPSSA
ncbi:MAG: O-antigen ligase family protein [Rhizobiaceae bacterium]|nr:O-antigen ligase family protein [Rhizobiaceae bacterium]